MTLVLAAFGRESIWAVSDRRLSYPAPRKPRDDARKMATLEAVDGVAILCYAGLGATAKGNEPADWIVSALRNRNLPLETSLGELAATAREELVPHLKHLAGLPYHVILAPAFVAGKAQLFAIETVESPTGIDVRFARYFDPEAGRPRRIATAGSGSSAIVADTTRLRSLLRLVAAHEKGKLTAEKVADGFAAISHDAHLNTSDGTVGPNSIVCWRYRREGRFGGGGGSRSFSGLAADANSVRVPSIATGIDVGMLVDVLNAQTGFPFSDDWLTKEPDPDAINAELARQHRQDKKLD